MAMMSPEERRRFLLDRPRTAKVATVRPDGRPHIAPVWFDLDGEDIVFLTAENTVKAANLRENPHVAVCVEDDTLPYAFVTIEGAATLESSPDTVPGWAKRIGTRYIGPEQAELFSQQVANAGELVVRVTPTRVVAISNVMG